MGNSLDRLVRKEVSLGAIRELQPPQNFLGLQIAPWLDVDTDDVIFDYLKGFLQDGLAPARAEDAEAEMAQKDDFSYGSGRAAIVDWSLKDKYTASDIQRYREDLRIKLLTEGANADLSFNYSGRQVAEFNARLARDAASRKRRLDNRVEWLIMTAMHAGKIAYSDGKINIQADFQRPADQQNIAPTSGLWDPTTNQADMDPIADLLEVIDKIEERTGVRPNRGLISKKVLKNLWKSPRFLAALGLPIIGGVLNAPLDPNYLGLSGYTPEGALRIVEEATGVTFTIYDNFYRTRPIGSTTYTNNRFTPDNQVILWPGEGTLGEIDDTKIGFAKTLTSPHPEGNWSSGFYEWEDESKDPWMHVTGTGVKAFPVFPYMEYTATVKVLA